MCLCFTGARSQYVDVMNPKPASNTSVPSALFSTLPNSHSAPAIFNPMGGSNGKTCSVVDVNLSKKFTL